MEERGSAERRLRVLGDLALALTALLGLGCASVSQLLAAFEATPSHLEAQGPGTLFGSIECAAVDALIYAYLQAEAAHDGRMRGGTIYATSAGYSYDEVAVGRGLLPRRISYPLGPRDVARFHYYPRAGEHELDRRSELASEADRRSVRYGDPLHRPLYILHPSLEIRAYRGVDAERLEVAQLRRPTPGQRVAGAGPSLVDRICPLGSLSDAGLPLRPDRRRADPS